MKSILLFAEELIYEGRLANLRIVCNGTVVRLDLVSRWRHQATSDELQQVWVSGPHEGVTVSDSQIVVPCDGDLGGGPR